MQLFIIAIIIPWLMLLSKTSVYKWVRNAGAIMAAIAAVAWIVERSSGKANLVTEYLTRLTEFVWWGISSFAVVAVIVYMLYIYIGENNCSEYLNLLLYLPEMPKRVFN